MTADQAIAEIISLIDHDSYDADKGGNATDPQAILDKVYEIASQVEIKPTNQ